MISKLQIEAVVIFFKIFEARMNIFFISNRLGILFSF